MATVRVVSDSGEEEKLITLTEGDDKYENTVDDATILALGGNDSIENGNGYRTTGGNNVLIDGGTGNDSIRNHGINATVLGGAGNDFLFSSLGANSSIAGGAGDDDIFNEGSSVSIDGGDGNDSLHSFSGSTNVTMDAGDGDDTVRNESCRSFTVIGGDGNDAIYNYDGDYSSLTGGAGNDTVVNDRFWYSTINSGEGDDVISLSSDFQYNMIEYTTGEGNDTIWGFDLNSTIRFDGTDTYSTQASGDDVIIHVGVNTITLKNFRDNPEHIIIGASGTTGGGSGSGSTNAGGRGSSGSSGNGGGMGNGNGVSNGISGGAASSGTNAGRSNSSSGTSSSRGNGGNTFRRNNHSTTADAPTVTQSTTTPSTTTNSLLTPTSSLQTVYAGGNQVVSDYTSGERIVFGAQYTGAFFDGAGNFFAGSTTGALVVQNAADKVIDLTDAAGNSFVKAYAATTAGVIDGRGLGGFEVINGSAGTDAIYAGNGGSQLWGGADVASDAMMGGGGTDIFIGGKNQGADYFLNASAADIVHLNDTALSDIVATAEENGTIGIAFNTGNVVAIQSSEALSATVMLADGSAYRFNHANKSWQSA